MFLLFHCNGYGLIHTILCIYINFTGSFFYSFYLTTLCYGGYFTVTALIAKSSITFDGFLLFCRRFDCCDLRRFTVLKCKFQTICTYFLSCKLGYLYGICYTVFSTFCDGIDTYCLGNDYFFAFH